MMTFHPLLTRYAVLAGFVLQCALAAGQALPNANATTELARLEVQINEKRTLVQTRSGIENIYRSASATGDYTLQARSLNGLIKVRDLLTEDSLYFRNSGTIDTLLASAQSHPKLKAILFVMQAQRLTGFDQRSRRFNAAAYQLKNQINNYAALTSTERLELSRKYLDSALQLSPFNVNETAQLMWLPASPGIFLFEPQFQDIVLWEKVTRADAIGWGDSDHQPGFVEMLKLPAGVFAIKLDSLAATGKTGVLNAYRNWMDFNKSNEDVRQFIESLARKSIYKLVQGDSAADKAYEQYLLTNTLSAYGMVRAHAVYQLCLQWNMDGNRYKSFTTSFDYLSNQSFNPDFQYLPAKALQLYEQHKALFENYAEFKAVLEIMAAQIKAKALRVEMSGAHLPGEALALKATYKNTDTLYYRIIKTSATEPRGNKMVAATAALLQRPVIASGTFALPLPADHNVHATHLKLDGLPAGRYRLLFSHAPITVNTNTLNNIGFTVTNIVAINTDERVFVLSRKTGFPLVGAQIAAFMGKKPVKKGIPATLPAGGFVMVAEDVADSLSISFKGDTIGYDVSVHENELSDDIYDEEEYDDLDEFYDDKLHAEIFTDRSIYRPGQTVHYKIILLTQHPKTGETILFNKQNLGGGLFKSRLRKWLDENDEIELKDAFGKTRDSARLKINAFGSFAGSFTLPKDAATGDWTIQDYINTDYSNSGSFRVEEYKRPTIELSMEKQSKMLLPGQPFTVKLKLRSFNGSGLNNVPIKYTINRTGNILSDISAGSDRQKYIDFKLLDTLGYTNAKGELSVPVYDSLLANANLPDSLQWSYNYRIYAGAVDVTGESTELDDRFTISSRPVSIKVNINGMVDKQALPVLNIRASNVFEGDMERKVQVKIYTTGKVSPYVPEWNMKEVDQWYYPEQDWFKWFPKDSPDELSSPRTLVLDTVINTASGEKLVLNKERFGVGYYELEAITRDNDRTLGKTTQNFTVFDSRAGEWAGENVDHFPINSASAGGVLNWYTSGKTDNFTIYHTVYVNTKNKIITKYQTLTDKAGIRQWKYIVPADATGRVLINRITVENNEIHTSEKRVYVIAANKLNPDIIVERYRKVMAPGAEETFSVSVKTKDENIVAELMTTLYDASLDKLEPHRWELPRTDKQEAYLDADWDHSITSNGVAEYIATEMNPVNLFKLTAAERENNLVGAVLGRVAGLNIVEARGLEEVVVVGFGTTEKKSLTGSVTSISAIGNAAIDEMLRKIPGFEIDTDGKIISLGRTVSGARLNGKDYIGGDINNLMQSLPADIVDKFQIVDDYGDQAALTGIRSGDASKILNFAISADGSKINILVETPDPVFKIRKNFNETAFFFPRVHAHAEGYYTFSFTMPETATEWNWKLLAHTRDARFAYLEKKLQTQLNLMVQPNMPRLLYQGDKIKLQSRVTNLDSVGVQGKATLKIEDAVTGEDITRLLAANAEALFNVEKKSSSAVAFTLSVPAGQINPLKMIVTATAGSVGDAEEHTIPVLSPKIFIRQSVPVKFDDKATISIAQPKLPADASLYGIGISISQKPQTALIYALPWLANYSFDCAEQTFNKLRAQAAALNLMQKDTSAQRAFANAKASAEKDAPTNNALPDEMAEATMPWLTLANNTIAQQKQLYHLLDTIKTKESIDKHLRRLYALQKPDGGLSWFDGGESNSYISNYVLAGFGQLKLLNWKEPNALGHLHKAFIDKLVNYSKDKLKDTTGRVDSLFALYALSYFVNADDLSNSVVHSGKMLEKEWANVGNMPLQRLAMLIINTLRLLPSGNVLRERAAAQLENIRQSAIQDNENGIRWKAIADSENMNTSAEETMALLAEAFELSGKYKEVQGGIIKWLLTAKHQEHWQTTKATAAAVDMLQKAFGSTFGDTKSFSTEINGKRLIVTDGLLDGKPTDFASVNTPAAGIMLKQTGINATGALSWYYFAQPGNADTLNKAIKIKKAFFVYDGDKLAPLIPGKVLKPGDRIQVKLMVETEASLQYVHISDPRAAMFEPKESTSGYRYDKGVGYYQSVRDTGIEFFTEALPRGISEFTYDLVVANSGDFTSGPASLQCMYQPALTAYSTTQRFMAE